MMAMGMHCKFSILLSLFKVVRSFWMLCYDASLNNTFYVCVAMFSKMQPLKEKDYQKGNLKANRGLFCKVDYVFFLLQHIVNSAIDFFQRFYWILIVDCGVWNHGAIGHFCNAKSNSWVIFL